MGLLVSIYRSDYDSSANVFYGMEKICVVNIEGPFKPTDEMPAAVLDTNSVGQKIIRPFGEVPSGYYQMAGGTFASSSDSRFSEAIGLYGAIPIHDRREAYATYEEMSR